MLLYHKKQWFCLQWGLHFHHLLPQHVTHFMILGSPILEYVTVRNIHFWISIVNDLSLNYYYYCFYHMSLIQGIFMSTDCLPKWATAFITGCSISRGFPRIQTTKPRKQPTHCQTQIWYSYWNISHKNIPYPCWNLVESLFLMVKSTISVTSLIEPSKFSGGFSSIFFIFPWHKATSYWRDPPWLWKPPTEALLVESVAFRFVDAASASVLLRRVGGGVFRYTVCWVQQRCPIYLNILNNNQVQQLQHAQFL